MKNLIIIGARGFGREVYNLATECEGYGSTFSVKGFLDDKADALNGYNGYPDILGAVESYEIQDNDVFICALGDPKWKKYYAQLIRDRGGEFITLIHPTAYIARNTQIGKGCIICRNTFVSCDIQIGDFVSIQPFSDLGHDAQVGDFCHLNTYSFLGGYAQLGELVTMHTGSKLLPHKKICNDVIVGAGSVVIKSIKEEGITVFGIPAKKLFTL